MTVRLFSYRNKALLSHEQFDARGIGQIKEHVNWVGIYATHVDVYIGPLPCLHKARVRRIDGGWFWKGLERAAVESGLCHR